MKSSKDDILKWVVFGLNRNSLSSFVTNATKPVAVCTGVPNVLNIDSLIRVFSNEYLMVHSHLMLSVK